LVLTFSLGHDVLDLHPIMQVHYQSEGPLPQFKKAVITIGTFDGVHLGHRQIIAQLKNEAASIGGESVIISFYPHPRSVIAKAPGEIKLLATPTEKIELLATAGIDHLVIIPFDQNFANQSAEAYITDFLVKNFQPHTMIIGYDHKFGKNRTGNFELLQGYANDLGFIVKEIPGHLYNESIISSTKIRHALLNSDIETANQLLGYPYFFEGTIVKGNQLGRTIGYPTANLSIASLEKLIPGNGVYAVTAHIKGAHPKREYNAMMNIGFRPTIEGTVRVIEVNLFEFDAEIYGEILQVSVRHFLRSEQKFAGLDALKEQLAKDKKSAIESLQ